MPVNAAAGRIAASRTDQRPDVVIIGDGIIGLTIAREMGRAGASCRVFGAPENGAASVAAAGLLAPSTGKLSADAERFSRTSLAMYPDFVESLREYEPTLSMITGMIEVSKSAAQVDIGPETRRLSRDDVAALEPELLAPNGGLFHVQDGAIDNVILIRALRRAVAARPTISVVLDDPIVKIELSSNDAAVLTRRGRRVSAGTIVVAAGAWSTMIKGLPRPLPVAPLKGQMLAVASSAISRPVLTDYVYLVPRAAEIVIGATAEHAGFDVSVVAAAIEELKQSAVDACPALAGATTLRSWAGIRPATPDMLPILGPDPADSRVVYACGHSKNGILLAPATGEGIAGVLLGRESAVDISAFGISRFPV